MLDTRLTERPRGGGGKKHPLPSSIQYPAFRIQYLSRRLRMDRKAFYFFLIFSFAFLKELIHNKHRPSSTHLKIPSKMKKLTALLCGTLMAVFPLALRAQQQSLYKIDKVTPAIVQTPVYTFQGQEHNIPGNQNGKWLEVEVQFESYAEQTDEMTVKYYVLVNGTLLAGEVTHVNIPKSRELYSVMYVSPRTLARLVPGKEATITDIGDVGVQLLVKGQVVFEKSTKSGYAAEWWTQMQSTTGSLLNKNETPFAPLYWDRYEAIKSADH